MATRIAKAHKMTLETHDSTTVPQHREDQDVRNPVVHVAGYHVMVEGLPSSCIFKFDMTGLGMVPLEGTENKTLTLKHSSEPKKSVRTSAKRAIKINTKLVKKMCLLLQNCIVILVIYSQFSY